MRIADHERDHLRGADQQHGRPEVLGDDVDHRLASANEVPRSSTSRLPRLVRNWLWSRLSGSVDRSIASSPCVCPDDAREHRLVEPEARPERLLLRLADVPRQQAVDRVAGQHPEQEEVEHRDRGERDQRAAQPGGRGTRHPSRRRSLSDVRPGCRPTHVGGERRVGVPPGGADRAHADPAAPAARGRRSTTARRQLDGHLVEAPPTGPSGRPRGR